MHRAMTPEQLIAERQALEDQIRAALWPMLQAFYRRAPVATVAAIEIELQDRTAVAGIRQHVLGRVSVNLQVKGSAA
jgi:hypothetical protein